MNHPLQQGQIAPSFRVLDLDGRPVSLDDYRGRKVLLVFLRNAACALCNLRVHQMIGKHEEWKKRGLEIVAVFESPEANMRAGVGSQRASFPLVADPEARLYELYGVETSEEKTNATIADASTKSFIAEAAAAGFALTHEEGSNFHRIPAEFLIDEQGVVAEAHYGRLITDHLPLSAIDRFAAHV